MSKKKYTIRVTYSCTVVVRASDEETAIIDAMEKAEEVIAQKDLFLLVEENSGVIDIVGYQNGCRLDVAGR